MFIIRTRVEAFIQQTLPISLNHSGSRRISHFPASFFSYRALGPWLISSASVRVLKLSPTMIRPVPCAREPQLWAFFDLFLLLRPNHLIQPRGFCELRRRSDVPSGSLSSYSSFNGNRHTAFILDNVWNSLSTGYIKNDVQMMLLWICIQVHLVLPTWHWRESSLSTSHATLRYWKMSCASRCPNCSDTCRPTTEKIIFAPGWYGRYIVTNRRSAS